MTEHSNQSSQKTTLGGGCFWCVEAVFQRLPGVLGVISGYAGGKTENPTYEAVCGGRTGHAEVIQIEFDPTVTPFKKILEVFWQAHDPTTLNQQGADVGTQYRSIILYHDAEQKSVAEASKAEAQKRFQKPIVTEIVPLEEFHPAEGYHQNYFQNNPGQPYCMITIPPKLEKLKSYFK